jgi:hypothetical protein
MKAAVALIVAAMGFYASVAWAGEAGQSGTAAHAASPVESTRAPERRAPAATPVPKARSSAPEIPTLRLPGKSDREIICACGPIDRHA